MFYIWDKAASDPILRVLHAPELERARGGVLLLLPRLGSSIAAAVAKVGGLWSEAGIREEKEGMAQGNHQTKNMPHALAVVVVVLLLLLCNSMYMDHTASYPFAAL
jgi:hypothetical protein